MTFDIYPWYGVTVIHADKIGPRRWRAEPRLDSLSFANT